MIIIFDSASTFSVICAKQRMFMKVITAFATALVGLCLVSTLTAATYSGGLTYTPPPPATSADGLQVGPVALNQWVNYTGGIAWSVTDTDTSHPGSPWKYTYTFGHNGPQFGISHVIIEGSSGITAADITGLTGATLTDIGLQRVTSGNPNMPEDMNGLRFNPLTTSPFSMTWSFFSARLPVWGDFYARCGGHGGGINFAYNYNNNGVTEAGFLSPDVDPAAPASAGTPDNNYFYHILRPDSVVVPEPGTLSLLALGALALFCRRQK
jgi:hypothetical protein